MSAGPNSVGPVGLPLRLVCTITTEFSPRQRVSMRAFLSTGDERLGGRANTQQGNPCRSDSGDSVALGPAGGEQPNLADRNRARRSGRRVGRGGNRPITNVIRRGRLTP
jgi:hypothetical protein